MLVTKQKRFKASVAVCLYALWFDGKKLKILRGDWGSEVTWSCKMSFCQVIFGKEKEGKYESGGG